MASHPALAAGCVAVITGAASGIGLAAARRFAGLGLRLCLADLPGPALDKAAAEIGGEAIAVPTDVSRIDEVRALERRARERFGSVDVLMNNAAIDTGGGPFENYDAWRRLLEVNLWGVINGVQAFTPAMIAQGTPGLIVNTGSKQGITTPPGNTAYNVSKAGVKVLTEGLAHELRSREGCKVTAHLLIPGFTHTGLTRRDEKPEGAWTAAQVVDFMLDRLAEGAFYILCPDNETDPETDRRRMAWAVGDIIEGRPALSRWHPEHKEAFAAFMARR